MPSCTRSAVGESVVRSEEHTSELQSLAYLVCRLLLEKKKKNKQEVEYRERICSGGVCSIAGLILDRLLCGSASICDCRRCGAREFWVDGGRCGRSRRT